MNPMRIVWSYEWYKMKTFCCAFFTAAMMTMVAAATIVRFPPCWSEWLNWLAFLGTVDSEVHIVNISQNEYKEYKLE